MEDIECYYVEFACYMQIGKLNGSEGSHSAFLSRGMVSKELFLGKSDNSWGFWLAASGSLLTKSSKASAVNKSIPGHCDLLTVT